MTEYLSQASAIVEFVTNYGVDGLIYVTLAVSSLSVVVAGLFLYLAKRLKQDENVLHFLRAFTIGIFLADIGLR